MQIKPILAALRKHRLATLLIALEIALACAVLCNASFMIAGRLEAMHVPSGVDESRLGVVSLQGFAADDAVDLNARVVQALRGIPGVQSVSVINAVPFGERAGAAGISLDAARQHFGGVPHFYVAGPGAFEALGLQLVAGHAPGDADYRPIDNTVPDGADAIITQSLAEHLWPGANPLGKTFWGLGTHFRVSGIVARLVRPAPPGFGPGQSQWSIFVPARPGTHLAGRYLVRAQPQDLGRVMAATRKAVRTAAPEVVVDLEQTRTLDELRHDYFEGDRAMTGLLVGVIVALLLVTDLGIVGLASFWVAQRRKQIGVRRALGATRGDILSYFQTENFLIVTFGVGLGVILAYAINLTLMQFYELPRLPFWYLPVGAVVLWLLGQLAVLAPALRASHVPPVVATRSV